MTYPKGVSPLAPRCSDSGPERRSYPLSLGSTWLSASRSEHKTVPGASAVPFRGPGLGGRSAHFVLAGASAQFLDEEVLRAHFAERQSAYAKSDERIRDLSEEVLAALADRISRGA